MRAALAVIPLLAAMLVAGCEYSRMQPSGSQAPVRPPPIQLP
jgi:hypothetical protein